MQSLPGSRPDSTHAVVWLFGPFRLAAARGRLTREGADISLERKPFETLVYLVAHRDRVVPREELLRSVWAGATVSDAAIASALRDLRRAIGDTAAESRFIATVRGRGYRFVHAVREVPDDFETLGPSAWEAAAVYFERALEALEMVEASRGGPTRSAREVPRERGELIVALARARWSAGATQDARAAFLEAASAARASGDGELLSQAALGFAGRSDVTPGVNREAVGLLEESLAALPERDSSLRAELMARLGTELYYDEDPSRSDRSTADALAMAERVGDESVAAYAATARHFACQRPEYDPRTRLDLADRAIASASSSRGTDVLVLALQERLVDLLELGEGAAYAETLERYADAVEDLAQPFFLWLLSMLRGADAMRAGRIEDAEALAHATLEMGQRIETPNALGAFAGQLFAIRREQGRLAELAPALETVAGEQRALPIFRAGLAAVAAATSRSAAQRALEDVMARDLVDFPRDQNWIATLGTLVPAAVVAGHEGRIRQLRELLEPYAGRMIVVGQGAASHGAVSHQLGRLSAAISEREVAVHHLEAAVVLYGRAHAPLWRAHALREIEAL